MRSFLLIAVLACAPLANARAQDAESKAVQAVVQKLFDGMRARDTATMRALFIPQARMLRRTAQGTVNSDSIDGWLSGIGRAAAGVVYDERTWAHEVSVDGEIAQAWMQYAFYAGPALNHCGVDAFDLIKVGDAWKIVSVMDTSRRTGCTPPPGKP